MLKKLASYCYLFLILLAFLRFTPVAFASITNFSDTLTTSRPSPSTPLSADAGAGSGGITIYNNGSTFLASDSAKLFGPVDTLETLTVATVSAAKTSLFFTSNTANSHTNGTVVVVPITAMHTVQFTPQTNIPSGGSIQINFPGTLSTDTNSASPSAVTFMFNGLTSGNASTNIKVNGTSCSSFTISQSTSGSSINCDVSGAVSGGTTVTFLIGCTAASGASCTTQSPRLINPTKSLAAGLADTWNIRVSTYSSTGGSGTLLDTSSAKIGTIESVNVVAHIDPTFTFTISGVAGGLALSTVCTDGGNNPDTTDSDFPTTSSDVNLGTLTSLTIAHKAQKMIITSNTISGYAITATSSGHLLYPGNGFYIQDAQTTPTGNDTPSPVAINAGDGKFGIHPCDLSAQAKVNTTTWGSTTPKYANPSASFYYTLTNSASAGPGQNGDTFYVEYSASPTGSTPPGDYHTTLTYVASTTF